MRRGDKIVKKSFAKKAENHDRQLGRYKHYQIGSPSKSVAHVTADEIPEAESRHERRHDQCDRVNIRTRKENQQALPNDLIEQSRETGDKENDEGDPTVARRARFYELVVSHSTILGSSLDFLFAARCFRTNSAIGRSRG